VCKTKNTLCVKKIDTFHTLNNLIKKFRITFVYKKKPIKNSIINDNQMLVHKIREKIVSD